MDNAVGYVAAGWTWGGAAPKGRSMSKVCGGRHLRPRPARAAPELDAPYYYVLRYARNSLVHTQLQNDLCVCQ
jgi:hypothetical protein